MKLEIAYQTQNLPAPYAFSVLFRIATPGSAVSVDFEMAYLERDAISEEEIIAEGYTMNDDFSWKGDLGSDWKEVLKSLEQVPLLDEPKEEYFLQLTTESRSGYPDLPDDVLIQELIQAVFEAAQKEEPLTILFLDQQKKNTITWKFADRKVEVDANSCTWKKGYELMQLLYSQDFNEVAPSRKPSPQSISFDSEYWFPIANASVWKSVGELRKSLEK